jgi:phosphatidylglycerol:prolipoprotein diacylglycerol transferase
MYPILVQFGPLGLRALPAVWVLGVWAGVKVAAGELRRRGLDPEWAHDFLMPAAIAGLVGARLFYALAFDPGWFATHPRDLLSLWSGLAFPGALLAGWGAALWFCQRRGIRFWAFADGAVVGVVLGQAIGALGSFLNGSGYGTPTAVPWAVVFRDPRGQAPLDVPVHPTQFYEALALLVLFGGLWMARRARQDGVLFLLYLAGLSALAPLDFLKGDALWVADVVPVTLIVSLGALLGAGAAWARRRPPTPAGTSLPGAEPEGRPVSSRSAAP